MDEKYNLAHGEIYARDGSVLELEIKNNTVMVKVRGRPNEILNIEITFRKFTKRI